MRCVLLYDSDVANRHVFRCRFCQRTVASRYDDPSRITRACTAAPGDIERLARFGKATWNHLKRGAPRSTQQQIDARLAICQTCEHYDGQACRKCGCRVSSAAKFLNKLAWADQRCPVGQWGAVEPQAERPRFVRTVELAEAALTLAGKLPPEMVAVAGVPRSGMIVASLVACYSHRPLLTVSEGRLHDVGRGWRSRDLAVRSGLVVVIDDTVHNGGTLTKLRPLLAESHPEHSFRYAVAYCHPTRTTTVDWYVETLDSPHLLEWNLFNAPWSAKWGWDLDGIISHNPPQQQTPLYPPRYAPVRAIITARLERQRHATEVWLARHGVRYDRLTMHPADSESERDATDVAAWKVEQLGDCEMYLESEPGLAAAMAKLSRVPILCPAAGGFV